MRFHNNIDLIYNGHCIGKITKIKNKTIFTVYSIFHITVFVIGLKTSSNLRSAYFQIQEIFRNVRPHDDRHKHRQILTKHVNLESGTDLNFSEICRSQIKHF